MLVLDIPFLQLVPFAKADTITPNNWVTIPVKSDPIMQGLNIPTSAVTQGMWSGVQNWPINGLHTAVLPDGRVLTYGTSFDGNEQDGRYFDVWDSALGFGNSSHNTSFKSDAVNSFCGTSAYLSNGNLLVSGGNNPRDNNIFTPSISARVKATYTLASDRWYATMVTLPDGRPIILGGMPPYSEGQEDNPDQSVAQGLASMTPEVLETNGWRSLPGANSRTAFGPDFLRSSMPRAWVAPSGQVFGVSSDKMWYLDPTDNGSLPYIGNYKQYGGGNPIVNAGTTNTAVMYAPGKILMVGGNGGWNGDGRPASNQATVIDINAGIPVLTEQPNMLNARRFANSIVLANGQVVVTGGTKIGNNNGASAVYSAEIWTPTTINGSTGTWSTKASAAIFRGYHSQTVLMPNGTILSTAGGAPGPVTNLNAEVYYPPYLFQSVNGSSQLATRPVIKAISGLSYDNGAGMQMDMDSTASVSQLVLVGVSTGTHSFNTGQRRIPLAFTQESFRITTALPSNNIAPPGYYQVVALDAAGVPSLGAIIAVGQNQTPPQVPTSPYVPPDLGGTINAPVLNSGGTANYSVTAVSGITYSWNFGDGTPDTPYNSNPAITHTYTQAGLYVVTLSAKDSSNIITRRTFLQAVATTKTANSPINSTPIMLETRAGNSSRVWVVNPDNDSVSVIDDVTKALAATINVGVSPRTLAVAPDGRIWVINKGSATISVISQTTLAVVQTITLPRASQPHGLAFAPAGGGSAYIALEAIGQLLKLNSSTGAQQGIVNVGSNPRHVTITADATKVLVSRFITPPLPGESTAAIDTSSAGAEVLVVNPVNMTVAQTITLRHSDKTDTEIQGSGIPNYLSAAAISPDGTTAWVSSKQDNIKSGVLRNGQNLNFQNTVRAISSRIDMNTLAEDYGKRIDHDNSSVGSAAVYHPSGVYMFVALETSRQVAVVDAIGGRELFRLNVGRAPQGLTISPDGNTLYVQEFMDRSVSVFDLSPLTTQGLLSATSTNVVFTVATEKMSAQAVLGKQLFYDAKDSRLARDSYMSCASCHNDAGQDGRVWDLTGFGEGLRNTIALKGRAGTGHGFLHWSANFDEVQDFEKQIRDLAGGTGLMTDTQFNTGTRNQPLGDPKAGVSASLDDLAAYLSSLNSFAQNPNRNTDGTLTAAATAGKTVFSNSCVSCHTGRNFSNSNNASTLTNVGTIKASSGNRLGAALIGIDTPTLLDTWANAPYLHNGSASTLSAAITAHNNLTLNATDLSNVVAYTQQIGSEEIPTITITSSGNWKFDEASGNTVADSSGNAHPLTLTNVTRVAGKAGQAGQFNGTSSSSSTTVPIVNTSQSFTVSAWVKLDSLNGWQTIVSQDGNNVSGLFLQYSQPIGSKFALTMHDADSTASNAVRAISTTTPVIGQWYHLVGVRDKTAGTLKIYVNNVLEATTVYTGGWASNGPLVVGRAKFGSPVDWVAGAIDELYTFNSVVTDADVTQLYNSNTPSNVAPTVSLTAPTANAIFTQGTAITLSAAAADSDGTVSQVEFFDGATLVGTDTSAPYSMSLANAAVGTHSLTAKATDNNGGATTSAAVSVTVNAPNNVLPTVSLTAPTANAIFTQGTAITLSAAAADSDGTVSQVEFFDGATLVGTDTSAPYSMSLANAAVGTHSLTAKATDNNGGATTSAAVSVTVNAIIGTITSSGNWKFDEASGNTVADSSGNAHPLTLTNVTRVAGKAGQAGQFNGTSSSSSTTVPIVNTSQSFTVSAWVKLDSLNGWQTIVSQDGNNVSGLFLQYSQPIGSKFALTMHDADSTASNAVRAISTTTPVIGQWYHLVGVRDKTAGTLKIYVNNVLEATTVYTGGWASNGPLVVGRAKFGSPVDWVAGAIDELYTFNSVVTDADVTQLYNSNTPSNVAPTVSLTAPTANAIFTQGTAITLSAAAADSDGTVSQVEFFDGATLVGTDTSAPYSMSLANAAVGTHSLTAKATDNNGGATTSAAVSVTVNAPNNVLPTVSLTAPTANAIFTQGTAITLSAAAADSDGTVSQVEFFDGATLVGTDTSAPYSMSLANAAVGTHSLTAKATDNNGGATTSAAVSVTVNAPNNVLPTVSLTAPTANAIFTQGTAITLSAAAADSDGTVSQVEFFDGATLVGTDTSAPYSMSLANAAVGTHSLTAKATDNNGGATTSAAVSVTVNAIIGTITSSGNWKFDEASGNTVADSSGNAHPLTLTNVTRVAGKAGQAGQFNGTSSSSSTTVPIVNTSQSFTVSAWVKLDSLNGWQTIVSQDGNNVSGLFLQYSQPIGSKFALTMHDADSTASNAVRAISTTTPVIGQWYHLVGVRDKTAGTLKIYVNNVLEATTVYTGGWASNGPLVVGRAKFGSPVDWVAGAIDELYTFNSVVTDADVTQLYNSNTPSNVAPTVSLTAPTANAIFTQGTAITLSAAAADSDGTVSQVEFFDGATLVGTDTSAPYSMSLANAAVGTHSLTAKATDNNGGATTSAAVSVTVNAPNNVLPTVSLTAPTANAIFTQGTAITLSAAAADSDGTVSQVEFFDGATLVGTDTSAPYSMSLANAAVGTHSLTAKATDNNGGATTSAAVSVTVNAPNNVLPTVSLTAPTANAIFTQGTAITLSAAAADSDGTVSQVEFFDGATLVGTDTSAPYSMSLANAAVGTHSLTAKATDNNGGATTSAAVSVTVNAPNNVLPTVSLTAPTANAIFTQGTAITLSAAAADSDGTVSQVEFFDGATLVGTDTSAPYSMSLANAAVGTHSLTAKATDNNGGATTSAAVSVTVNAIIGTITSSGNWKFDEASGNTVADSSGNAHPLTLTNVTRVAGKAGQAGQFNGTSSSSSTTVPIVNTSQSFTVSAWVKLDSLNGWQTIVSQDGNNVSGLFLQYSQPIGSKFALTMHDADSTASNAVRAISTTTPVIGQWYHLVGVRDKTAGTLKIYVNNVLEATTVYTGGWASNGPLVVGRAKFGSPVDWVAGAIDELYTFNSVVTDADVTQLYNSNTPSNVAPTVSLTAPTANAIFTQGTAITLSAAAADSDGTVSQVEFFDGATLVGTDTSAPYSMSLANAAVGTHSLTAKATDNNGGATTSAAVSVTVNTLSTGLLGSYFANTTLIGLAVLERTEAINFSWGTASPAIGVPADTFPARWSGQIEAPTTGAYRFRTNSDEGVRVYVDNALVINNWTSHTASLNTSSNINLTAGQKYNIVVEYYDATANAVMQL